MDLNSKTISPLLVHSHLVHLIVFVRTLIIRFDPFDDAVHNSLLEDVQWSFYILLNVVNFDLIHWALPVQFPS